MLILNKLKDYSNMSDSEVAIANYIMAYPREVVSESIERFAEITFSSPSTIVRFCKKLGFKGFTDFKIKLASEMGSFDIYDERVEVDMPILPGSDTDTILKAFYNLSIQTLKSTFENIDRASMEEAAKLLHTADSISIMGVGPSLMIAGDLHYKMRRLGYNTELDPLLGYQHPFAKKGANNEVVFIVSSYANSHQIKKWIVGYNRLGIKIILVTGNANSPFIKLTSATVVMDINERRVGKMGAFASRIALTYAVDCIYALMFNMDYAQNVKALYDDSIRVNHYGDTVNPESGKII